MSATCVPWYVPRANTGLSKHGNPVFPHLCPLNQTVARVPAQWEGGYDLCRRRGAAGGVGDSHALPSGPLVPASDPDRQRQLGWAKSRGTRRRG